MATRSQSTATAVTTPECANCGAALTGMYCSNCGELAHRGIPTVSGLLHDVWHSMTHVDGRVWQTMYMLLRWPGRLTQEYFSSRRGRHLPPVRMYLALSVVFFALGIITSQPGTEPGVASPNRNLNVDVSDCGGIRSSFPWLQDQLLRACTRNAAEGGTPVRTAFVANIPRMMFVFLPLMAVVSTLLYLRQHRFYVEHVVFFLHTHAALFLILLLEWPLSWAITALRLPAVLISLLDLAVALYAAWYIYRAMRVYYGQSRRITLTKLAIIGCAYAVFLVATLMATLVISALTA